jgi:uncharacterized protein YndB with AHSA1/START domain
MDKNLKLTESVTINASTETVWRALTDVKAIEEFMWGTHATSDWKVGSSIIFEGVYQGKPYRDKGTILEMEKGKRMKYTFLGTGNEDKPENYSIITYDLSGNDGKTNLKVTQEGAQDQKALEHSREGWRSILGNLKKNVEEKIPA